MLLSRTLAPRSLRLVSSAPFRRFPALPASFNRRYVSNAKDDDQATIDKKRNTIKYKAQTWEQSRLVQYNSVDKSVWHERPINRPTTNGRMVVRIPHNALNKKSW